MIKKIAATAVFALAASAAFAATPTGFYIGADAGSTKLDDIDGHEAAYGAFAGYGINQNVAVELGYRKHGDWDTYGGEGKIKQTHVSVIGSFPINNQLDVYGRLGYSHIKTERTFFGDKEKENLDRALFGIGLNMNFTANLFGRVEVQKMASDATTLNLGLGWKF